MKSTVAVVADCANIEAHGKLNIMGIFDVINVQQLPAVHPQMQIVVRLVADPSETKVPLPVEIQLVDEDWQEILSIKGQTKFQTAASGEQSTSNFMVALNNVRFGRVGDYEFKVLVCEEAVATIPLRIQQMQPPAS